MGSTVDMSIVPDTDKDDPADTLPPVPEYDKQRMADLDFDDPRYSEDDDEPKNEADDESLPSLGEDDETDEDDDNESPNGAANKGEHPGKNPADVSSGEGEQGKPDGAISEDLLFRAVAAGIPEEQAKGFGSAQSLRETVRFLEGRKQAEGKGNTPAPAAEAPALEDLNLDLDDFDDTAKAAFGKVADHFGKLKSHYEGQTKQLTQAIAGLQQQLQMHANERTFDEFDSFLGGLGKNFTDKIGEGDRHSGKLSKEQIETRQRILSTAAKLADGKPLRGFYKQAANAVLSDKASEVARKDVADKLQKRSKSSVSRPTNRQSRDDHRSPEQRAVARLKEMRAERGIA